MLKLLFHNSPLLTSLLTRVEFPVWLLQLTIILSLSSSSIFSQTASFTFESTTGSFCAPAVIRFQPTFSESPISFFWQFGTNNEESEALSPTFSYSAPGTYRVILVVLFRNELLEIENFVNIYASPKLNLNVSKSSICKPDQIDFSIQSDLPLTTITWEIDDGFTQTGGSNNNSISHFFNDFNNYNVKVITTSARGCESITSTNVVVQRPGATVSAIPLADCVPIQVTFNVKMNDPAASNLTTYFWNFDDGTPTAVGNSGDTTHTYTRVNTFRPTVSVLTSEGCSNTFSFPPVTAGGIPTQARIATQKDTICASERALFTELDGTASSYIWELSNGAKNITTTPDFNYKFNNLGNYMVKVTPEMNGCKGLADSLYIEVIGVIASFSQSNSCANKSRFAFRSTSTGRISTYRWNFGDGSNIVTLRNPNHQFAPVGTFPVELVVRDNVSGCADSTTTNIYTALPLLIPTDTFLCRGSRATLSVIESYGNPRALYTWRIANQTINNISDSSATVVLSSFGTFANRVIIHNGPGYCRDTLRQNETLRVGGPIADFKVPSNVCRAEDFSLIDSSRTGFISDRIVLWNWNFGNGTESFQQNPDSIRFATSGNFRVRLLVTDEKGCIDSISNMVRIRRLPLLRVIPGSQKICEGQEVTLRALTRNPLIWSPSSEVPCSTCTSVVVNPVKPTTYTATTSDSFGCTSSQSVSFDVWPSFTLEPNVIRDTAICPGGVVTFDLKTTGKLIQWLPTTGLTAPNASLTQANTLSTVQYTATVTDSGRCFTRSVSATIVVNPFPQVDMGPDIVLPYDAPFTISPNYTGNITSYTWQPANLLSCRNCPNPSGRATQLSYFTVDVVTDKGCLASGRIQVSVVCNPSNIWMPNAFTPNNDGLNDTYYPLTRGIKEITKFVIYNRFGELVFQRNNFTPNDKSLGWNGQFKGQKQSTGGFVYFVEGICELGDKISKKGNFVIMR